MLNLYSYVVVNNMLYFWPYITLMEKRTFFFFLIMPDEF